MNNKIKRLLMLFLILNILVAVIFVTDSTAVAAELKSGDFNYIIKKNQIRITKYTGSSSKVTVPYKINGKTVVTIGSNAFNGNTAITDVILSKSIKTIDYNAFMDCSNLKSIHIQAGLKKIGSSAFYGCSSLEEIILPENLVTLEWNVFGNCTSLKKVTLPSSLETIPSDSFYQNVSLTEIDLPDGLQKIERSAFNGCSGLKEIALPSSIKEIGSEAFRGCISLAEVVLPDSLTYLGPGAFMDCSLIESIALPSELTNIITQDEGGYQLHPFMGCSSLKEIIAEEDNPSYKTIDGILYNKDMTTLLYCPSAYQEDMIIPDSVTEIGGGAFAYQSVLKEILIPDTVETIGFAAFYNAVSVESIKLPKQIDRINGYVFNGSGIITMTIPEGVTIIDDQAFARCKNLKELYLPSSVNTIVSIDEFGGQFVGCISMEAVCVKEDNINYYSKDGILFQYKNDITTLMYYPAARPGKSYKVPAKTELEVSAFDNCKYLKTVTIPEGLTRLWDPFSNCSDLKVYIPRSVVNFPSTEHVTDFPLFRNCTNCYAVVYEGSASLSYCKKNHIPYIIRK